MTLATRRSAVTAVLAALVVLGLAACGGSGPSASPSSGVASLPPTTPPAVSPSANDLPSASVGAASGAPASAAPSTPAVPSPAASALACAMPPAGTLPSDRFTGVQVIPGGTADGLRFTFGNMSTEYGCPARPAWTIPFCTPRPVTPTMFSPM